MVRRHSGYLKVVGRPSRRSGSGQETLRISESGRETLPDIWKCLGELPAGLEVDGRPSRRYGSARETLQKFRKWSGNRPSSVPTLPEVRKWSGNAPEDPVVVGTHSRWSGSDRETF